MTVVCPRVANTDGIAGGNLRSLRDGNKRQLSRDLCGLTMEGTPIEQVASVAYHQE